MRLPSSPRHVFAMTTQIANRGMATRTESDAFGPLEVEDTRLWGAQTQRSIMNFPIGGAESKMPLQVIHAFGVLKKCAADYNMKEGKLDKEIGEAMMARAPPPSIPDPRSAIPGPVCAF